MIVAYQRVSSAEVQVGDQSIAKIGRGALILVGISHKDDSAAVRWMAQKVAGLRVHEDDAGKLNLSLQDVGGEILAVSQFTLLGDCRKGKRPSFTEAAPPEKAEPLFVQFVAFLRAEGISVQTGIFGEHMQVSLSNDGPVTLIIKYPPR